MLGYIIYILIISILLFIIYLTIQAISRGIEAKRNYPIKENNNDTNHYNDEIKKLKKLLNDKTQNK